MKSIILTILIFTYFYSRAQTVLPIDSVTGKVTYTSIIDAPDRSKDQLFVIAKTWFAISYKSANAVIQMEDKEAGKIIGKGIIQPQTKFMGMTTYCGCINHVVVIDIKDNKLRYTIDSFIHEACGEWKPVFGNIEDWKPSMQLTKGMIEDMKSAIDGQVKALIESLETSIVESKSDDW